jgi:hypothetical protein
VNLKEMGLEGVDWIQLAQGLVNTVINLQVPLNVRYFSTS